MWTAAERIYFESEIGDRGSYFYHSTALLPLRPKTNELLHMSEHAVFLITKIVQQPYRLFETDI